MINKEDIIILADENGEELETVMLDTFTHEGNDYAILVEASVYEADLEDHDHEHGDECGCGHDHEMEIFIMKFEEEDGEEVLVAPEDSQLDALAELAIAHLQTVMEEEIDEE